MNVWISKTITILSLSYFAKLNTKVSKTILYLPFQYNLEKLYFCLDNSKLLREGGRWFPKIVFFAHFGKWLTNMDGPYNNVDNVRQPETSMGHIFGDENLSLRGKLFSVYIT